MDDLYNHPGASSSRVWRYFGFKKAKDGPPNKENLDMKSAVCRLCLKTYANKGNTTNMMAHLRAAHNQIMIDDLQPGKTVKMKQPQIDLSLKSFMPILPEDRVKNLDDKLLRLIVGKVLPLSLVDSQFFKDLLKNLDPRYQVPSRKTVTSMLVKKKEEMSEKLKTALSKSRDISITHDGWTSIATESFQTVTVHFITDEWELKSAVLETRKLTGSHTAEAIAEALTATKTKWNLPVPTATTDNAANEIKAFSILQWERFGCYGHRINLAVKSALGSPEMLKLLGKGRKLVTFFHQSSSAADLLREHQLIQLKKAHKLIQDCPTRWNSSLSMLERLLEQTPPIMAAVHDPKCRKATTEAIKAYSFNFQEQGLVEKIIEVLKPFEIATSILCAENVPTLPKVIPTLLKLKSFTTVKEDDGPVIKKLKGQLAEQMEKRSRDTDLIILANVLNPCTKDMQCLNSEEQDRAKQLLKEKMEGVTQNQQLPLIIKKEKDDGDGVNEVPLPQLPQLPAEQQEVINDSDVTIPKKKIKLEDMESWLDDVVCTGQSQVHKETLVEQELSNYFAASSQGSSTMLDWWKTNGVFFPRISVLARKFLAIPASSVPSERVFSLAGGLVNKKRARMSPEHIDTFIFLNRNMKDYW